jgi:RNA polymerase sigma-70 factor (ECF subfamily)
VKGVPGARLGRANARSIALSQASTAQWAACSDEALVQEIRSSSEAAFTALYERYYQRVYSFSYLRLRNHADTEEVVQETFTAVFRSIEAFHGKSTVLSWIYGIAKNTVNNHIRRSVAREQRVNRAERELVRNHVWSSPNTPEEELTMQRCAESLREQLASVADWQAEIFLMRHVENLAIGEIAERTSRSNDAVRSSLSRVKRQLVESVQGEGSGFALGRALA